MTSTSTQAGVEGVEAPLFIAGEAVSASQLVEVRDPSSPDEVVGLVAHATAAEAARAVAAADKAFAAWSATTPAGRRDLLAAAHAAMVAMDQDVLAVLLSREQGKTLREAQAELAITLKTAADTLELASALDPVPAEYGRNGLLHRQRRPHGVATAIVPWNWPVSLMIGKVFPALLAGNTLVVKIPSEAPLTAHLVARVVAESLPAGVLNLVSGTPADIGETLVGSAAVRHVSFTGSVASGRAVMRDAAAGIKRVTLELGGNDPALVLQDAELDLKAVRKLLACAWATAGQGCQLVKRVYVHQDRYDELVDLLGQAGDEYVVGAGLHPDSTMGAVIDGRVPDRVARLAAQARDSGATATPVGRIRDADEFARGHFVQPQLVLQADPQSDVVTQEQFAPILPVVSVTSDEQAVHLSNDSEFGLCASVWTADADRFEATAAALESGTVLHNNHNVLTVAGVAPYGGFKQSGMGREGAIDGLLGWTELQITAGQRKG